MGRVYHHEIGKRHTSRLQMGQKMQQMQGGSLSFDDENDLQVAPGEPVPPGFEGKVQKVAEIQVSDVTPKILVLSLRNQGRILQLSAHFHFMNSCHLIIV